MKNIDRAAVRSWFPPSTPTLHFGERRRIPGSASRSERYSRLHAVGVRAARGGYAQSMRATALVAKAHEFIETFMNATGVGKVVLGPSTTYLVHELADTCAEIWQPGDEVIIAESNHEANAGPWAKLAKRGIVVRTWEVDPTTFQCSLESLNGLLNEKTRMVAFPHVSNLLGEVVDVKAITDLVHQAGAKVIADGVAFAPHRAMDVAEWGVDWYVYSTYKVYGPHMAALYGSNEAFAELTGPNHFFIPRDSIPYKFELGSISHEGCAGLLALREYLRFLADRDEDDRQTVVDAFAVMEQLEQPLQERLIRYLRSKPSVRIIGLADEGPQSVCTISFIHNRLTSSEIVAEIDKRNIGIRYGHMYAVRLCNRLGIDLEGGVVRVSLVHYNTLEEVQRLIEAFEAVL